MGDGTLISRGTMPARRSISGSCQLTSTSDNPEALFSISLFSMHEVMNWASSYGALNRTALSNTISITVLELIVGVKPVALEISMLTNWNAA